MRLRETVQQEQHRSAAALPEADVHAIDVTAFEREVRE
jgi:hypothetical protein